MDLCRREAVVGKAGPQLRAGGAWYTPDLDRIWTVGRQEDIPTLVAGLPAEAWPRLSTGEGSQGPRWDNPGTTGPAFACPLECSNGPCPSLARCLIASVAVVIQPRFGSEIGESTSAAQPESHRA